MTTIEWADTTWNPVTGCDRVSPGCDHCYALGMARRLKAMGSAHYQRDGDSRTSGPGFGVTEHPDALELPLRWRKPRRVFVNSMGDLFHDGVSDELVARVWAVMAATPQHTFQCLTKRHGRMRSLLNNPDFWDVVLEYIHCWLGLTSDAADGVLRRARPYSNVWLVVSVEDQKHAELRVPALLDTPAAVRGVSCEPLLSAVNLTPWCGIDWVICGGESGPGARPMHPDWVRQLRDQCVNAGVPYFFKQWGEWAPIPGADDHRNRRETDHYVRRDGYPWPLSQAHGAEEGTEVLMRRVGKHAAGRELDGREWNEFPVRGGDAP